jgi:CO/xanthine dehydrogenase Mo-binding subunit
MYDDNRNALYDATDTLLSTAREYGHGSSRGGDVVAAAYRLAAAKLRENGSDSHAKDLERAAEQAEKLTR